MKNKIGFKKYLIATLIAAICLCLLFLALNIYEYHAYTKNFNHKISALVSALRDKYPDVTEEEIITILNSEKEEAVNFFAKYAIDLNRTSILISNDARFRIFLAGNLLFLLAAIGVLVIIFVRYNHKIENDIKDIIECIEQINKKNYELQIDTISEDELSILKTEIYKTTVILKEAAENSNKDKVNLKKSMEDISHQLKTPLTSILVMLDNMIEDPDMDPGVRNDFVIDIKRNVVNINFLVQNILKLSKFDASTIKFMKAPNSIKAIAEEAIKNVSPLCDLKNVNIEFHSQEDAQIVCDYKWQVEAVTNILKNAIDHSKDSDKVIINMDDNNVYSSIDVINYGEAISKKDMQHIFERFYKGENAKADSVGIGLALAKTIINEDNGTISVESDRNETRFSIKYFKI